jgi:molybdopterin synthase catalytic subunit
MDFLKTDAPFWKAEERDGKTSWVEARDSDTAARDKWHDDSASPSRSGSGD